MFFEQQQDGDKLYQQFQQGLSDIKELSGIIQEIYIKGEQQQQAQQKQEQKRQQQKQNEKEQQQQGDKEEKK